MTSLTDLQAHYTAKAEQRLGYAFDDWRPELGFRKNKTIMDAVYYAYQSLYRERPNAFLWAGLARLTGGQVLFGMNNLVRIARDPSVFTCEIVAIAKDIYFNLAWQHESYLDNPALLIEVCRELDAKRTHNHAYADCWTNIQSGQPERIALGNRMLLENEQHNTVQPHYEVIRKDPYSARFFWFTRFVLRNIHPYHRRFVFDQGLSDVTEFKHRWRWIARANDGMWDRWVGVPLERRMALVALDNERLIRHQW
jgi:hypothetical protein